MRHQRLDHWVQLACHNDWKIVERQFDPMIGHAVLREIVSSDPLVAFAGTNLRLALGCVLGIFLSYLALQQTRAQNRQRAGLVLMLRAVIRSEDVSAGRYVTGFSTRWRCI